MPQEICELIDFHVDTFPLQKVSKYEWCGNGMGVLRQFDTEEDYVCVLLK